MPCVELFPFSDGMASMELFLFLSCSFPFPSSSYHPSPLGSSCLYCQRSRWSWKPLPNTMQWWYVERQAAARPPSFLSSSTRLATLWKASMGEVHVMTGVLKVKELGRRFPFTVSDVNTIKHFPVWSTVTQLWIEGIQMDVLGRLVLAQTSAQ